jgi:hypothetical protein
MIYLHSPRLAASIQNAGAQGQGVNVACSRLQASDQLPRLQIPHIDFAVEASAVKKGAFSGERQYRLALFSAVLERTYGRDGAAAGRVYAPQQYAAVSTSRYEHLF